MTWLVTGGAGYIGAHVVAALRDGGERVVVLDDLSTGDRTRVAGVTLVEALTEDGYVFVTLPQATVDDLAAARLLSVVRRRT